MKNMSLGITAFVVSVGIVSVSAQGRNFSGTWIIDGEKTAAAAQASGDTAMVTRGAGGEVRSIAGAGGGGGVGGAATGREVRSTGTASGGAATGGGGGGRVMAAPTGAAVRNTDTVIAMDANTFTTEIGGVRTSYPLNGTEVVVQMRNTEGRAKASWKGDTLVIETTLDTPNGPLASTTSWYLEGDSLVRLTSRKTYFKKK